MHDVRKISLRRFFEVARARKITLGPELVARLVLDTASELERLHEPAAGEPRVHGALGFDTIRLGWDGAVYLESSEHDPQPAVISGCRDLEGLARVLRRLLDPIASADPIRRRLERVAARALGQPGERFKHCSELQAAVLIALADAQPAPRSQLGRLVRLLDFELPSAPSRPATPAFGSAEELVLDLVSDLVSALAADLVVPPRIGRLVDEEPTIEADRSTLHTLGPLDLNDADVTPCLEI